MVVHPAGTGHSNISDEGDYSYLAFFPDVCLVPFPVLVRVWR